VSPNIFSEPSFLTSRFGWAVNLECVIVYYCFVGNERDIEVFVNGEIGYIEGSFCDLSKCLEFVYI